MDKEKWNNLLKKTGEYGVLGQAPTDDAQHLGLTIDFFKSLDIDNKNKRFLDIGCGDGRTSNRIKSGYIGIDLFAENPMDAHELEFDSDLFDIVFCSHTLEHTISPLMCLLEIKRVVKESGDVIIGVPVDPGFFDKGHNYILTKKGWSHLIKQAGLKIIKTSEVEKDCISFHCKK